MALFRTAGVAARKGVQKAGAVVSKLLPSEVTVRTAVSDLPTLTPELVGSRTNLMMVEGFDYATGTMTAPVGRKFSGVFGEAFERAGLPTDIPGLRTAAIERFQPQFRARVQGAVDYGGPPARMDFGLTESVFPVGLPATTPAGGYTGTMTVGGPRRVGRIVGQPAVAPVTLDEGVVFQRQVASALQEAPTRMRPRIEPGPGLTSEVQMQRPAWPGPSFSAKTKGWSFRGSFVDRLAGAGVGIATSKYTWGGLAATGIAGMTGFGGYALMQNQVDMNKQAMKSLKTMRNSLRYGGMNRRGDFEYNPMMTFSRPRVRAGHLGANGGLTLALNRQRSAR